MLGSSIHRRSRRRLGKSLLTVGLRALHALIGSLAMGSASLLNVRLPGIVSNEAVGRGDPPRGDRSWTRGGPYTQGGRRSLL